MLRQTMAYASAEQYMSLPIRPKDPQQGIRVAVEALNRLCTECPYLERQPRVLFSRGHCLRMLSQAGPARRFYRLCASSHAAGWSTAAAAELWLLDAAGSRRGACPRKRARAWHTTGPVHIDGRLDEAAWRAGKPVALTDPVGRQPSEPEQTTVRLAWDQTYIYLAARVPTTHGRSGPPRGHSPVRDRLADGWPSLEWFIDVDRDAATYYRISVDELGNVVDAHNDDLSWSLPLQANPLAGAWQYIVAHDENAWIVEMAVPVVSLFPRQSLSGQLWATQIVRRDEASRSGSTLQWLNPQPGPEVAPQHFALLELVGGQ
jgi:hypothetical protein